MFGRRHHQLDPDQVEHGPWQSIPWVAIGYLAGAMTILGVAWVGALSGWLAVLVFAAGTPARAIGPQCLCRAVLHRGAGTDVGWMLGDRPLQQHHRPLVGGALLGLGQGFAPSSGFWRFRCCARPSPSRPCGPRLRKARRWQLHNREDFEGDHNADIAARDLGVAWMLTRRPIAAAGKRFEPRSTDIVIRTLPNAALPGPGGLSSWRSSERRCAAVRCDVALAGRR